MEYVISRDNSANKISAEVKTLIVNEFLEYLKGKYGEDKAGMVRITSGTSKINLIGVVVGSATDEEGDTYPIVVKISPTVAAFSYKTTDKRTTEPFDFEEARETYDNWVKTNEEKATLATEKKAKKIAEDKAAREAKKKVQE